MAPVTVTLLNDYDVVVRGLHALLQPFTGRIKVVEGTVGLPSSTPVDVTLYDTFARPQVDVADIDEIIADPTVGRVCVYTWNVHSALVTRALDRGFAGYLDKTADAPDLVHAIERVAAGEVVVPDRGARPATGQVGGAWPGQQHGLSAREAEVLALITQGLTNEDISAVAYLSINTVKTYIRTAYRKIGVTRRSQAVRWGMEHEMLSDSWSTEQV